MAKKQKGGKKNRKHGRNKAKCEAYAARRKQAIKNGSPLMHKERRKNN